LRIAEKLALPLREAFRQPLSESFPFLSAAERMPMPSGFPSTGHLSTYLGEAI
jgi:hypothetical protein